MTDNTIETVRAGRSGGATLTLMVEGVSYNLVSQKPTRNGENPESLSHIIHGLLERAWGHSEPAARKARQIAVALQQWPNKTEAGKACERKYLLQDIDALSEMMRPPAALASEPCRETSLVIGERS